MSRVTDLRMLVSALPVSLSVRRIVRSHRDLGQLLAAVDDLAERRSPRRNWGEPDRVPVVAGWCFRFRDRSCVQRSLTTYALLRRQGESPHFVSGVVAVGGRQTARRLDGHAWVELDGSPIGAGDRSRASRFSENYRHPSSGRVGSG